MCIRAGKKFSFLKVFRFLGFLGSFRFFGFFRVYRFLSTWYTGRKYVQEAHEGYSIHCYDERYKIIATPINSSRFTDFDFKNKNVDLKK